MLYTYIFLSNVILFACAFFTKHFAEFLEKDYGTRFKDLLQRSDLGSLGSFGGKTDESEDILNDPVVFVHGVSDVAGLRMQAVANRYKVFGYKDSELYSTTYAYGARVNPLQWTQYSMKCEYVKQIRALILAVRYYTRKNVDVVAFSLGVPIARKAILGGQCVDTSEELGSPLSPYVDAFLGIAGPNHGITFNVAGVSLPACALGTLPICDRVVGLYSGLCPYESEFLKDINREHHYEGRNIYSIYSHADERIGYKVCGKVTASINGENDHKSFRNLSHDQTLDTTHELQVTMIQGRFEEQTAHSTSTGTPSVPTEVEEILTQSNVTQPLNREGLSVHDVAVDSSNKDLLWKMGKEDRIESPEESMEKIRKYFRGLSTNDVAPLEQTDSTNMENGSFAHRSGVQEDIKNVVGEDGYHTRIIFKIQ